ncbi:MAG: branched-chain-amino-acid transaminase [Phycisphaerae bacterium]|nr:branched-chain-amino-acid transaminase [Phycisphaerae bacterium]
MKVWLDGQLVERDDAKISVFDHGLLYGDGVFEGIRVYGRDIFQPRAHLDRLFYSAEKIRLTIPYTREELLAAMKQCVEADGVDNGYFRLVVTRGVGNLGLNPFQCSHATTFIIFDQLRMYTDEMYEKGMAVIIAKSVRRAGANVLDPSVKSLNYLNNILAKIECVDAGVLEVLMCNDKGYICEASGDNVFIVKGGVVKTPRPDAGILLGVTRGVVMHLARREGFPVEETDVAPRDVLEADECFLTGTGAEVIAVTKVDEKTIGDGKVGPITRKLLAAFRAFVHTDEEVPYGES